MPIPRVVSLGNLAAIIFLTLRESKNPSTAAYNIAVYIRVIANNWIVGFGIIVKNRTTIINTKKYSAIDLLLST